MAAVTRDHPSGLATPQDHGSDRRHLRIARALILVVSAVGFAGLWLGSSGSASTAPPAASDFLLPAADQSGGRIHHVTADGQSTIPNGSAIELADDLVVTVWVDPYPPVAFDESIELLVTSDDQPVTDADVSAVWDMAVMYHGPFETRFGHLGDGRYRASFDFFMYGPWSVAIEVARPGHATTHPLTLSIYTWPE